MEKILGICRDLKLMSPIETFLTFDVTKDGSLLHSHTERAKSWTRNHWNILLSGMSSAHGTEATFGAGYISVKGVSGGVNGNSEYNAKKGINSNNIQIFVGTDDTAFDIDDYALSEIADGSASGELVYQTDSSKVISYDDTVGSEKWECEWYKIFNNNSGDSIVVKETGIKLFEGYLFTSSSWGRTLLERTVLASPVTVADGAQLTVTYTLTMDYSAID